MKYQSLIFLFLAASLVRAAEPAPPVPAGDAPTAFEPPANPGSPTSVAAPVPASVAPSVPAEAVPKTESPGTSSAELEARIPTAVLPTDLNKLLERIRTCTAVWEKQPATSRAPRPGEFEKMEKFKKELSKNHCNNLSRSLISMREKYHDQPEVVRVCDGLITQPPEQYKALRK